MFDFCEPVYATDDEEFVHLVFDKFGQTEGKLVNIYLINKCTTDWLFFSIFSSILKKEGREKEEWVSKNGF